MNILIKGGYLITPCENGEVKVEKKDVYSEDGVVRFKSTKPVDREIDATNQVILPGLVNTHHHIYSCLSKGIPCEVPFCTFERTLAQLWWLLDQALDSESTKLSTVLSMRDSLKAGVTTVFDHHISGNVENSLSEMGEIFEAYGVNGGLAFETTTRNGQEFFEKSVAENSRFAKEVESNPILKGLTGMHALLTLPDKALDYLAKNTVAPIHCHVAEGGVDQEYSWRNYGKPLVERLDQFGLLRDNSLIIHASNLTPNELKILASKNIFIGQAIDSNMNNGLNAAKLNELVDAGLKITAGTDGMHSSCLKAQKNSAIVTKFQSRNADLGFPEMISMFFSAYDIKQRYGFPLGVIEGQKADLTVTDYEPMTSFDANSFFGHYFFGITEARVQHVIKEDKVLLDDFNVNPELDKKFADLLDNQIAISDRMFARFEELKKKSTYLSRMYHV